MNSRMPPWVPFNAAFHQSCSVVGPRVQIWTNSLVVLFVLKWREIGRISTDWADSSWGPQDECHKVQTYKAHLRSNKWADFGLKAPLYVTSYFISGYLFRLKKDGTDEWLPFPLPPSSWILLTAAVPSSFSFPAGDDWDQRGSVGRCPSGINSTLDWLYKTC